MRWMLAKDGGGAMFFWCRRCHHGFDEAYALWDPEGDMFCPWCGARAVDLIVWGFARSLYRHFPPMPLPGQSYEPRMRDAG